MSEFRRIGYLGGTFDPPHLGHLKLAGEALTQLDLNVVKWLITPRSPHKTDREISPTQTRLSMLELVLEKFDEFTISTIDLNRDPPYYAVDTVEIIKKENPEEELVYIIGEDSLVDLPSWYQPERFLAELDQLAVAPRPGYKTDLDLMEVEFPGLKEKTVFLTGFLMDISSSMIREKVKQGDDYQEYLTREVAAYIVENQLYRQDITTTGCNNSRG